MGDCILNKKTTAESKADTAENLDAELAKKAGDSGRQLDKDDTLTLSEENLAKLEAIGGLISRQTKDDKIKDVIETGKRKGVLTYKEINDALEGAEIDAEHLDKLLGALEEMKIDVIDGEDKDILDEEEDVDADIDLSVPEGSVLTTLSACT